MSKTGQWYFELSQTPEAEQGYNAYMRGDIINPYRGTPK